HAGVGLEGGDGLGAEAGGEPGEGVLVAVEDLGAGARGDVGDDGVEVGEAGGVGGPLAHDDDVLAGDDVGVGVRLRDGGGRGGAGGVVAGGVGRVAAGEDDERRGEGARQEAGEREGHGVGGLSARGGACEETVSLERYSTNPPRANN